MCSSGDDNAHVAFFTMRRSVTRSSHSARSKPSPVTFDTVCALPWLTTVGDHHARRRAIETRHGAEGESMTYRLVKPLALAVGLALSINAVAAPAVFDVKELDTSIKPCADFNGFVNAQWVATHPIPADRTRWGSFDMLREDSLNVQHKIVDDAAANASKAAPGSIQQKIGYLYASGMDEAAVNRAGFDPIKPQLAQIDGLKNAGDIAGYIRDTYAKGEPVLFRFGGNGDFKDSSQEIAYVGQGGLGLPTVDYYSKPEFEKIRTAYVAHIAKLLALTGVSTTDAQQQAKNVLAFETRLAAASLPPVEMRKPENRYHYVSIADADKLTPSFDWTAFFKTQDADVSQGFSFSQPKFFGEVQKMFGDVPVAQWQAYFRYHAISNASPYLSTPFEQEDFAFENQTLNGQKEIEPRWKRVLAATNDGMGMALGQLYVAHNFLASPSSAPRNWSTTCAPPTRRASRTCLDERGDQAEGAGKMGHLRAEDRLPRQVARLVGPHADAGQLLRQRAGGRQVQLRLPHRQDRQAGRPQRMGHDAADGERLLQRAAERDRVPGSNPAAAVLRRQGR
jgi:hypothetical protein